MNQKYILPFFLLFQIIILQFLPAFSAQVETYYSNGLYPKIASFLRIIFGFVPFSVGDVAYFIVIILAIRWFWKNRKTWKENWKNNFLRILSALSLFYFFFHFLWAFNYYRESLSDKMQIKKEYSDADLLQFTNKLILKTNQIHSQINENDSLKVVYPYSKKATFSMNLNGYQNLSEQYAFFNYEKLSIKNSLFSLPLTYMGFGGYLNPFTNEAQVNGLMPIYNLPFTSCHEMAHQMGFASESECNFIGFLATTKNDDLYYKYSGYSYALRYCLGLLSSQNEELFKATLAKVNPGVLENYRESDDFWKEYETPIETGFKIFYDNFLKINQQRDGLESYSKFVDLMVNYYKTEEL